MFSDFEDTAPLGFEDTHADEKVLRFLKKQISDFMGYVKENYPDDELTKNLVAKYADVQLLPYRKGSTSGSYNSGSFDHSSGILRVAPRDGAGKIRDEASLNKTIVHELSHGTRVKYIGETSHSHEWKDAWKHFLKIATENLGWAVESSCSTMKFYGLEKSDCPRCRWDNEDCPDDLKPLR